VTKRRFTATFIAVWAVWLAGLVPIINLLLPIARGNSWGEAAFVVALLAYFASPYLLIAWLD
jgi:hypothetical protein